MRWPCSICDIFILDVCDSCSSWASSGVVVTGGCRCRGRGTTDFSSVFWCVEVKSDSGRRDSNPGFERSQPKTLTTAFFFVNNTQVRIRTRDASSTVQALYERS